MRDYERKQLPWRTIKGIECETGIGTKATVKMKMKADERRAITW